MSSDEGPTVKIEPTREFRPAGIPIQDAIISKERSGIVQEKAATKPAPNAMHPPLSERPIPTTPLAERIRERLKKGG
jgi:hypothetical protein